MPQMQLPIFSEGITPINQNIGFVKQDGSVTYFYGSLPVFTHDQDDVRAFQMFTSQLYINGSSTQAEICRAFGVTAISVKRSVKRYRQQGVAGFFQKRKCRGAAVLTSDVLAEVQALLDTGTQIPEIGRKLDLKADTLYKAVRVGKLHKPQKKTTEARHIPGSAKVSGAPWMLRRLSAWAPQIQSVV